MVTERGRRQTANARAARILNEYEQIVRLHEMKGAQPPELMDKIDALYESARKTMIERIAKFYAE